MAPALIAIVMVIASMFVLAQPAEATAASPCRNFRLGSNFQALGVGFTSCGTAEGVYAEWFPQSGSFYVDPSDPCAHVNATIWLYSQVVENYIEEGYWRSSPGCTANNSSLLNGYYYGIVTRGGNQTLSALKYLGGTPGTQLRFALAATPSGGISYGYFLDGLQYGADNVEVSLGSLLAAGYEQQNNRLSGGSGTSIQDSPYSKFANLQFKNNSSHAWQSWGNLSGCRADRTLGTAFDSINSFSTAFQSDVGPGVRQTYGCTNTVPSPSSPRSNW